MVRAEDAFYPLWVVLRGDVLWISLCWVCAIHHGRSGRAGLKEDHSLGNDRLVACCGVAGHIYRRWAHVRIRRIASSTRGEGTETVGGVRDVVHHPQSLNSFEAGKRSMISTRRLCFFSGQRENGCELRLDKSRGASAGISRRLGEHIQNHRHPSRDTWMQGRGQRWWQWWLWWLYLESEKKVKRREDMKTLLDPQRSTARW